MLRLRRLAPRSLLLTTLAAGCSMADGEANYTGSGEGVSAGDSGAGDSGVGTGAASSAGEAGGDGGVPGDSGPVGDSGGPIEPGQLTAGEWRDLDNWSFWRGLFSRTDIQPYEAQWGLFTAQRYPVVVTADGAPLADAIVTLVGPDEAPVWQARTDVRGEAELFAGLFDAGAPADGFTISVAGTSVPAGAPGSQKQPIAVTGAPPTAALDLMFVIDTTGSMGDELSYLQSELADVIARVRDQAGQSVALRLSVNFYRDDGDEYVVRPFPFTTDIDAALADLAAQTYDGGGDTPEAVDVALADAISGHQWSESATARLCFLVLDAPPHEDPQVLASVRASARKLAEQGVRLIPLAASGVDQPTEFLLRSLAIATGGTYTFLTNDSGIGGDHTEPTIGTFEVELLNDLLVRVIGRALKP